MLDVETAFWVAGAVLLAAGYGWGRRVGWTRAYEEGPQAESAETRAAQAALRASRESGARRPDQLD